VIAEALYLLHDPADLSPDLLAATSHSAAVVAGVLRLNFDPDHLDVTVSVVDRFPELGVQVPVPLLAVIQGCSAAGLSFPPPFDHQ
jgi:hypothetical protein